MRMQMLQMVKLPDKRFNAHFEIQIKLTENYNL